MQPMPVRGFHHFAFFQVNQHECALDGTNHERTKILIEYQHSADHAGNIESNFQVTKQPVGHFPYGQSKRSEQYPPCLYELMRNPAGVHVSDAVRSQIIHSHLARCMNDFFLSQDDADVVDLV